MNKTDLELFKEILKDDSIHFTIGMVTRVMVAEDGSSVALECIDVIHSSDHEKNKHEIICTQGFLSIGDRTACGDIADQKDLVLIAIAGGDLNQAFAISRLPSAEEQLPKQIKDGHFVLKSRPGKKLFLGSDTKVEIGAASTVPCTEPLVLGLVVTLLLNGIISKVSDALNAVVSGPVGIGNLGAPVPTFPALAATLTASIADLTALKTQYLDTPATNILSQRVFTERGGT